MGFVENDHMSQAIKTTAANAAIRKYGSLNLRIGALCLLMALIATPAKADSPLLAQSCKGQYSSNVTSISIPFNSPTTSGDEIKAYVFYTGSPTVTTTDTQVNTYSLQAGYPATASGYSAAIYENTNIAGGPDTVKVSFNQTVFAQLFICEMAVQNSSPNDGSANATGNSNSASSGPVTTTAADLCVGVFQSANNARFTPTGGFLTQVTLSSSNSVLATLTQGGAGAVSATATLISNPWFALVDCIKGTSATLSSIAVTPAPASMVASAGSPQTANTLQFKATGTYSDSTQKNLTGAAVWTSSSPSIASIATGGIATAGTSTGQTTITATLNSIPGTSLLTLTANPNDPYWGLNAVPCTNTGTAFTMVKLGSRWVFCTPAGHAMFARGFFGQDISQTPDETGTTNASYLIAKYGSTAIALNQSVVKVVSWGINNLPAFTAASIKPPTGSPPILLPFVYYGASSEYTLVNTKGWGGGASKDLLYYVKNGAPSTWNGQKPSGMADYRDPNYLGMLNGMFANDPLGPVLAGSSTAIKGYLLGFSLDESDGTHCFGAGPEFATRPGGNNDFRCGYLTFFVPPVNWANSARAQTYTDGKVYFKARMHDLLVTKYSTFTALNTAWGSSYTTLNSSGTCFGSQPVTCAATNAAVSLAGSGTGPYTATLSTTVSRFSVYVALAGVIGGGDTGTGTIYGSGCGGMSGTINYATGALSVTCTTTPGAVTAGYIQNGWQIGTGFMDEDCRAGHSSYCGTGSNDVTINLTGIPANVQTDINAMTKDWAAYYSSTQKSAAQTWANAHGFTGSVLNLGPTTLGTWSNPPDKYVVQGVCGNMDAWIYGGQTTFTQAMMDFVDTNCSGQPLIEGEYRSANAQSPFSWPNSACTHSGSSVTCVVATPNRFSTGGSGVGATCSVPSWNAINSSYSYAAPNLTYTASGTPSGTNATCNVFVSDSNTGGFASQALRASDFQTKVSALPTRTYTASGVKPFVAWWWWQYGDNEAEQLNWGPITVRDNNYDGVEDVNPVVLCSNPLATLNCGGELRGPYGGNAIAAITATNAAIDAALIGNPPPPTAATPTASPVAGSYSGTQNVTLSTSSPGAIICWNLTGGPLTDGASNCPNGTKFTTAISVASSETVFAVAGGAGWSDSPVGTFAYGISTPPPPPPPTSGGTIPPLIIITSASKCKLMTPSDELCKGYDDLNNLLGSCIVCGL